MRVYLHQRVCARIHVHVLLRAADTHADPHGYGNSNSNININTNCHRYYHINVEPNCHSNNKSDANCHSQRFSQCDTDTETKSHREAAHDTQAAPNSAATAGCVRIG